MTTIPPRILDSLFIEHLNHLLKQTIEFEKIFINIPIEYKRFKNNYNHLEILNNYLLNQSKFELIMLKEDYGPASKFLGPLLYKWDEIKDNILIIIDDDRFYDVKMCEIYKNFYQSFPHILFATGNQNLYFKQDLYLQCKEVEYKLNPTQYIAAFMSCSILIKDSIKNLIDYSMFILNHLQDSFYHDEGILLNYIKFNDFKVYNINYQFINIIQEEMTDSLIKGNFVNRHFIENEIRLITNSKHYFNKKLSKLKFF